MGENSKIQWTHHTFNPWVGCSKVHAGCTHCYAESLSKRTGLSVWGDSGTRVRTSPTYWRQPDKWNRDAEAAGERRRVFCASLADVFELMPTTAAFVDKWQGSTMDQARAELFEIIDRTPWLDWLLLTKRPENVCRMWPTEDDGAGGRLAEAIFGKKGRLIRKRSNVWIGCSISDQETADRMVPELLKCRDLSPVLFLSAEPLVGPVELLYPPSIFPNGPQMCCDGRECGCGGKSIDPWPWFWPDDNGIDWVIVGGESGHGARPCNVEWVRDIVWQCSSTDVPCFVKQLGAMPVFDEYDAAQEWPDGVYFDSPEDNEPDGPNVAILKDKKGGDWNEWPSDLRVREFPVARENA